MQTSVFQVFLYFLILLVISGCQSTSEKANYELAVQAWDQGRKQEAIEFLKAEIRENPKSYRAYLKLAEYYRANQEHEKAILIYDKASTVEPQNPEAKLSSGETYLEKARITPDVNSQQDLHLQGQHHFTKVLEFENLTEKQQFRALLGKGICLFHRSLVEDATPYMVKAASLNPGHEEVLFYTAAIKEAQLGANKTSIQSYEAVLAKNPNHLPTLQQMGKMYQKLGYQQKALEKYQQFLNAGGQNSEIGNWVAMQTKPQPPPTTTTAEVPTPALAQAEEIVMVCPVCGRCGELGQKNCKFDDAELIPME